MSIKLENIDEKYPPEHFTRDSVIKTIIPEIVEDFKIELKTSKTDITNLETNISELNDIISSLEAKITDLEARINTLEDNVG